MTETTGEITEVRELARHVFVAFLLTFVGARVLVILIMTRRIPDMFLHTRGTHVHHLNYGIFLISAVGAVLLFLTRRRQLLAARQLRRCRCSLERFRLHRVHA